MLSSQPIGTLDTLLEVRPPLHIHLLANGVHRAMEVHLLVAILDFAISIAYWKRVENFGQFPIGLFF